MVTHIEDLNTIRPHKPGGLQGRTESLSLSLSLERSAVWKLFSFLFRLNNTYTLMQPWLPRSCTFLLNNVEFETCSITMEMLMHQ